MTVLRRGTRWLEQQRALDRPARVLAGTVHSATRARLVKNALSGTWLGHPVHPVLSDVPIGCWLAASGLDLVGSRRHDLAARRLTGLGVLAAVPTAAAGLSDWSDTIGGPRRVGLAHAVGNVIGLLLQTAAYWARRQGRHETGVVLGTAGLAAVAASGYLGGHLSFTQGVGVNRTAFEETSSDWVDVVALAEVPADKPIRVHADGTPVVLVRLDGQLHALSATCGHAGGPLDEGSLVAGTALRCPWHGSVFQLCDGRAIRGPAAYDQPAWDVRTEGGRVQVRAATR